MADDKVYADLLDSLSPLKANGIDPDEANADQAGTMRKILGDSVSPAWQYDPARQAFVDGGASQAQSAQPAQSVAAPASVTQSGDARPAMPSLTEENRQTLSTMSDAFRKASGAYDAEAAQPDLNTQTTDLEAQRAKDAAPIPAYGGDGKVLPQYKPSFAQRLMRGVNGFARGGILGVVDPTIGGGTAYGAPSNQYGRDQQAQAARVASDDQQLQRAKDNWKLTNDRLKANASEARALATTGKDVTTENLKQQNQPNLDKEAQARMDEAQSKSAEAFNNSPEGMGQRSAAEERNKAQVRQQQVNDPTSQVSRLNGSQKAFYVATGRIPDPRQPSADEIKFNTAMGAWRREHPAGQPTVDDIQRISEAASGRVDGPTMKDDDQASAIFQDAEGKKQEFVNGYERDPRSGDYISKNMGPRLTAAEFQSKVDQFRKDANKASATHGYELDEQGNIQKIRGVKQTTSPTQKTVPKNPYR